MFGDVSVRIKTFASLFKEFMLIKKKHVNDIEDEQLDQIFNRFLKKLEDNTQNEKAINRKQIIKKFLSVREL